MWGARVNVAIGRAEREGIIPVFNRLNQWPAQSSFK